MVADYGYLHAAVVKYISQSPLLLPIYQQVLKEKNNNIRLTSMFMWTNHIRNNVFHIKEYNLMCSLIYPKPRELTEEEKEVKEFIKKIGWHNFRECLSNIVDNRINRLQWDGVPWSELEKEDKKLDKIKNLPGTLNVD